MSPINPLSDLATYAQSQINQHNIPGLSLAVWSNNQLHLAAAGVLNHSTGVEATEESIFQIGSITKVFTACLVMQLVDEGKVDLDAPVKSYLHDFRIANAEATKKITVRQLLNHTNGIAGDFFPDDHNQEGNLIARYLDRCNLLPLVHPVGEMYSYSNSAFAIAGRLVEVVRGISWYQAMQDYIYKPLNMQHAIADPKDCIRYRTAMGHVFDGDNIDRWVLPEQPYLSLGLAPVGSTPTMSAANLILFARAHLDKGVNAEGEHWLSANAISAMQTPQIALPRLSLINDKSIGLGWGLDHYHQMGLQTFGHAGATNGFLSMLQILPEQSAAYAILMNGFRKTAMDAINSDLLQALSGARFQEPKVAESPFDRAQVESLAGRYESLDSIIDITVNDTSMQAHITYKIDPLPPAQYTLRQVQGNCYGLFNQDGKRWSNLAFLPEEAGSVPRYLFYSGRLNNRL